MTELDRIREFVRSNLMVFDEGVLLGDDDNIFELGLVDSLFAIQLVLFVEGEFGINIVFISSFVTLLSKGIPLSK